MWGLTAGSHNLNHTDVAVTPVLLSHPFDQIIVIPLCIQRGARTGFSCAPGLGDHVGIAPGTKELCVARLDIAEPEMGPGRLGRHGCGVFCIQKVFVVLAKG